MSEDTRNMPYVTAFVSMPKPFVGLMLWSVSEDRYKLAKVLASNIHDASGALRVAKKLAKKLGFEYR